MPSEHDRVIETIAQWCKFGFTAYTNPGQQKNKKLGKHYPDVLWISNRNPEQGIIFEVEPESGINKKAMQQCQEYLQISEVVYLVVPALALDKAKRMAKEHGGLEKLKFGKYGPGLFGNISLKLDV